MLKKILYLYTVPTCVSCGTVQHDFNDIGTGILLEGKEVIVSDRNAGA